MDWDAVNVGLDQEAFKAAQAAGDTGFSIPWWIIVILVIVGAVIAFGVAKKAKDEGGDKSGGSAGDKE